MAWLIIVHCIPGGKWRLNTIFFLFGTNCQALSKSAMAWKITWSGYDGYTKTSKPAAFEEGITFPRLTLLSDILLLGNPLFVNFSWLFQDHCEVITIKLIRQKGCSMDYELREILLNDPQFSWFCTFLKASRWSHLHRLLTHWQSGALMKTIYLQYGILEEFDAC